MDFFSQSTQKRNWIKNEEELKEFQKRKIDTIFHRIKVLNDNTNKKIQEFQEKNPGIKTPEELEQKIIPTGKIKFLSKEKSVILHFTKAILNLINKKVKSRSLKTYALTYFRRFFLKKSCLDYDPEMMFFACIFLGGKVAQLNITLSKMDELIPILKERGHTQLLNYEFYLCTILGYDLYVFNPYKALIGFIYKMNVNKYFDNVNITIDDFENECEKFIDLCFLTDIMFLYNYSYISLCSIYLTVEKLQLNINDIIKILELETNINMEKFKSVYEKIKFELSNINTQDDEFNKVYGGIIKFYEKYKNYVDALEQERKNLLTKMNNFTTNLIKLENINSNLNNRNINANNINHVNNNNNINNFNQVNNINQLNNINNNIIEYNNGVNINNNIPPNNIEYLQNKRERSSPLINNNIKNQ